MDLNQKNCESQEQINECIHNLSILEKKSQLFSLHYWSPTNNES